jgi:hypothetical protein
MTTPHVYADFNALPNARSQPGSAMVRMEITALGTIRSLARQGLRLYEGMSVLLFEPRDIQCLAKVYFDPSLSDPAGRAGAWVAELDPGVIEDSLLEDPDAGHPCLSCGYDLAEYLARMGCNYTQSCPQCETSIMAPLAKPTHET